MSTGEIFVSYAWGGESEAIVNQLDQALQAQGLTLIRDKRDLGFKGRIKEFMEQIGQGKGVVIVISDKYLKSENCMFELTQIARNGQFYDRIFPIVLADAKIYKPLDRIKYIQHWEKQIQELDEAMKTVSAANLQGFREEIDLYTEIRNTIAELTNILKDMNTLTPEMHQASGFAELFKAIEDKILEAGKTAGVDKTGEAGAQIVIKPPALERPANLSFDEPMLGNQPADWFNGFGFVFGTSLNYESKIVIRPETGTGLCALLQNPRAGEEEFGSLMQRCLGRPLAGKFIRLQGEIKVSNLDQWAGMWLRVDGPNDTSLFFDNMHNRPIRGSTAWKTYTIDAPLPNETLWLNYGVVLQGRGELWADNFRVMVWENGAWVNV